MINYSKDKSGVTIISELSLDRLIATLTHIPIGHLLESSSEDEVCRRSCIVAAEELEKYKRRQRKFRTESKLESEEK